MRRVTVEVSERLEDVLGLLRTNGGRATTPRRAIIDALLHSDGHVTADSLTAEIQVDFPDVHLSTIYRCLSTLQQLGVVEQIHIGHGRAVYHLTDEPHQHLLCEGCARVIEVPDEVFADLIDEVGTDYRFALRLRCFALIGRCAGCSGD